MGRLKIKRKEVVLPFRDTIAYRLLLLTGSIILFVIALYFAIGTFRAGATVSFIAPAAVGLGAAFAVFYNMDHLRDAKIPQRTLKKMRRR